MFRFSVLRGVCIRCNSAPRSSNRSSYRYANGTPCFLWGTYIPGYLFSRAKEESEDKGLHARNFSSIAGNSQKVGRNVILARQTASVENLAHPFCLKTHLIKRHIGRLHAAVIIGKPKALPGHHLEERLSEEIVTFRIGLSYYLKSVGEYVLPRTVRLSTESA